MADGTRISQLADSLVSVKTNQDQTQKHLNALQEIVQGLAQKLDVVASHVEALVQVKAGQNLGEPGSSTQITNPLYEDNPGGIHTRAIRLDFPKFNGENPSGWIYRANQFFSYHQTNPHHRILLASFHMEGKALVWFQDIEAAGGLNSWEGFLRALQTRFGASPYDDPMEALIKLKQTSTVEEYKGRFEYLSNQLRGLDESYKLSCFLSGLREDIRFMVRMLNPINLHMAFGLAKMQEENVAALRRTTRFSSFSTGPNGPNGPIGPTGPNGQIGLNSQGHGPIGPAQQLERKALLPIQKLSPAQMRERREKGLCYNCDDKWGPGHRCKSARLFIMEGEDLDTEEPIKEGWAENHKGQICEGILEEEMEPEISIHALFGSPNPKTMRIMGYIGRRSVVILVDTGSTHNFVDPSIVKDSQLAYDNQKNLKVKVANGQTVCCEGRIEAVSLIMQGHEYAVDFYVLTLGICDIVLGIHWLRTLGPILWDFSKLQMEFSIYGRPRKLQGMAPTGISLIESDYEELWSIDNPRDALKHNLFNKFYDLFTGTKELHPTRSQDPHIVLLPDSKPVCVGPYRYSYFQKSEIRKLVQDMLAGIVMLKEGRVSPNQKFWKVFFNLQGPTLQFSSAYHPHISSQTEVINEMVEQYWRCFSGNKPTQLTKFIALSEWGSSASTHASTNIFEAVYVYLHKKILHYLPGTTEIQGVDNTVKSWKEILKLLSANLQITQERIKRVADLKPTEREFEKGNCAYLQSQPYKQRSLAQRRKMKLFPRCYSPFKVLDLPVDLKIQPVFHESCLRGKWNKSHQLVVNLQNPGKEGVLKPKAEEVLERRVKKMKGRAVTELLIKWRGLGEEEASWELAANIMTLWTRSSDGGDNVMCLLRAAAGSSPSTWRTTDKGGSSRCSIHRPRGDSEEGSVQSRQRRELYGKSIQPSTSLYWSPSYRPRGC